MQNRSRSRKPSDTSSVNTVTAASPQPPSLRRTSMAMPPPTAASSKRSYSGISVSTTMPSMSRTGASGNFLSRMWGAAKGEKFSGLVESRSDGMPHQGQSAFKRLVLVHSRSNLPGAGRGGYDASLQV
ncbi:hypothetical protein C8R44DRAFT_784908 [Mycena epipterygia]|nr:hypothetical protein C8R44DRAFT_784908 [Mycena epipterygia]